MFQGLKLLRWMKTLRLFTSCILTLKPFNSLTLLLQSLRWFELIHRLGTTTL
jgi:hypothetical protein